MAAASIAATACSDLLDVGTSYDRSALAVLLLQPGTPAPAAPQFYVVNSRQTTRTLVHPDGANTEYAQVSFPPGVLETINGVQAGTTDSVLVTAQPEPGAYGLRLSFAAPVTFSTGTPPIGTFYYARYGDFSASRVGSRYGSQTELANALAVWREQSLGRYVQVPGSGSAGSDVIRGSLQGGGNWLVAAEK